MGKRGHEVSKGRSNVFANRTLGWDGSQISILALDEDSGTAYFGEYTWSGRMVGENVYRETENKSRPADWRPAGKDRIDKYILFSKSGFTKGMRDLARKEGVLLVEGGTLHD